MTRAGLVEELARELGAWKIDPEIAFLSGDREHRTPFARTLRVLESAPWHERHFARRLAELGPWGRLTSDLPEVADPAQIPSPPTLPPPQPGPGPS